MCFTSFSTLYKCGKCPECLSDLRREWSIRLQLHSMYSGHRPFIAHLTYDNEHVPKTKDGVLTLSKKDVQDFIKRLRYYVKEKFTYYIAGEYGTRSTIRPHYHCLFFGFKNSLSEDDIKKTLQRAWQNGYVRHTSQWVVSYAQLHYCTKYVINFYDEDTFKNKLPPFRLSSTRFGADYISYAKEHNLYHEEIQKLFECTFKKQLKRSTITENGYIELFVPDKWLNQEPYYLEYDTEELDDIKQCRTLRRVVNPILKQFPDFIEIYEINNKDGKPRTYRYPVPRYFAERLYTRSFRAALAIRREIEAFDKAKSYLSRYSDYDKFADVPYWLQLKRYNWEHKKKNYKDKIFNKQFSKTLEL